METRSPVIPRNLNCSIPDQTYERVVKMLIIMVTNRQDKVTKYQSIQSRSVKGDV